VEIIKNSNKITFLDNTYILSVIAVDCANETRTVIKNTSNNKGRESFKNEKSAGIFFKIVL